MFENIIQYLIEIVEDLFTSIETYAENIHFSNIWNCLVSWNGIGSTTFGDWAYTITLIIAIILMIVLIFKFFKLIINIMFRSVA